MMMNIILVVIVYYVNCCYSFDCNNKVGYYKQSYADEKAKPVYMWGLDRYHQISGVPDPNLSLIKLYVGYDGACGIDEDNYMKCWGGNSVPQYLKQVPVKSIAIRRGLEGDTCVLTDTKSVHCFGSNENQIVSNTPSGDVKFNSITNGNFAACGIKEFDNKTICWGSDKFHQITMTPNVEFIQIDGGWVNVCGIHKDTLKVTCWGYAGKNMISGVPDVQILPGTLSVGQFVACGIKVSDSTGVCWGYYPYGQLKVPPDTQFKFIHAGYGKITCGIRLKDDKVMCWGNDYDSVYSPVHIIGNVPSLKAAASINVGSTTAGILVDGVCIACKPGTTSNTNHSGCRTCYEGEYNTNYGQACSPCPAGFFCPDIDKVPIKCPAGSYCVTNSSQSILCAEGTYDHDGGRSSQCLDCPAGSYCPTTSTIEICPAGSFCPAKSSKPTKCTVAGYYCPKGVESPVLCDDNYYCLAGSSVEMPCDKCSHIIHECSKTHNTVCLDHQSDKTFIYIIIVLIIIITLLSLVVFIKYWKNKSATLTDTRPLLTANQIV